MPMRSRMIVIVNIGRQNSMQVTLVEDQDPVEAFLSNSTTPAFGESMRIGSPVLATMLIQYETDGG